MTGIEQTLVDTFRKLSLQSYEAAVYKSHGTAGVDALVILLVHVRELLKHVPHEMLTRGVAVVAPVDPATTQINYADGAAISQLSELSGRATDAMTLVVLGANSFRVWYSDSVEIEADGPVLVYRYVHREREELIIEETAWEVNDTPWSCKMAIPTFTSLDQALLKYMTENRVPVQCAHLATTWRDGRRLAFVEKPEKYMRRSLLWALQCSLTDVTVRPEQNQSETKPVDIEVVWTAIKRSAIIEIKWLGDSGPVGAANFTTSYPQSRAISGLKQLADYLDLRDAHDTTTPVMGYLVVFDARRRALTATQTEIDSTDGLAFEMSDPEYPADILARPDMGRPYRCFMEPICS